MTNKFDYLPKDPNYNYGSLLPIRQAKTPGASLELGLPDWLRNMVNAVGFPGQVARGETPATPEGATNMALQTMGIGLGAPAEQGAGLGVFRAFHGTPHTFDPVPSNPLGAFADSAIGSGEGAAAYGHGHYLAENPSIAETYQKKLAGRDETGKPKGNLYEVEAQPEESDLLDWNLPLDKQSNSVKAAIAKIPQHVWDAIDAGLDQHGLNSMSDDLGIYNGKHLYQALKHSDVHETLPPELPGSSWITGATNEQQHTSAYLKSLGIPGMKFLDAGSRKAGETELTHNYVMFDPTDLKVVGKK